MLSPRGREWRNSPEPRTPFTPCEWADEHTGVGGGPAGQLAVQEAESGEVAYGSVGSADTMPARISARRARGLYWK
ncbi:hypothetical protein AB0H73_23975 [Streptomyces olivoreticuli]